MPKQVKITCDSCDKDITYGGPTPAYRIIIASESLPVKPNKNGCYSQCAILVRPPIDATKFFCSLKCLRQWLENANH